MFRAAVPSGASTGIYEAVELRDKQPENYHGKGVIFYAFIEICVVRCLMQSVIYLRGHHLTTLMTHNVQHNAVDDLLFFLGGTPIGFSGWCIPSFYITFRKNCGGG